MWFAVPFIFLGCLCISNVANSTEIPIIFDRKERSNKIPHFRAAQSPFQYKGNPLPTRNGLDQLSVSASGQLSEHDIRALKDSLTSDNKLIIIDLRWERHGFLNGEPISWNIDGRVNNMEELLQLERKTLAGLIKERELIVSDRTGPVYTIPTKILLTEREVANKYGVESKRFPTKNLRVPSDEIIDQYVDFVHGLDPHSWVHLHCREGTGRATTYMIMFDMLHNGDEIPKEEIILRHYLLGGANIAKYDRYSDFQHFLDEFYRFSKKRLRNKSLSWSKFSSKNL